MKRTLIKTLTLLLIVVFGTMIFASCADNEDVGDVEIDRGKFARRIDADDLSFNVMSINSAIAQGDDELGAILHLMEVAEHNYLNADYLARISLGGGKADAAGLKGKMAGRSFYLREYDKEYSQTIGRVYEGEPQQLLGAAQKLLDQAKRSYTINRGDLNNEVTYIQEPKSSGLPTMLEEFPYASCDYSKAKLKIINKDNREDEESFHLKHKGELTNFVISRESIVGDTYSISYNKSAKLYTAVFEIDLSTEEARNAFTERPRASLRKTAGSDDLEYIKYKVILELWDNGLIRTISTEESWEATLNLTSFAKPSGSSQSTNVDYYSWDDDDAEIEEYVKDGYICLEWIPKS